MAEINGFAVAQSEDSRTHKFGVGADSPPREVWARSSRDVSVLDAGLGQRQSQRLGTAPLRGVVP